MKSAPYWWEDAPLAALPAIELPTRADTVIIGAGYTGLSAALTLLRAGRSVIVIEAALAAEGASSRNGGMCGDLLKPSFTQLSARYGKQSAVALYSEVRDALVFLQEVIADNKIECDFARVGRLTGALSQQQLKGLESEAEILRKEIGTEYQIVSGPAIHDEIGSDLYVGARILPHHGGLHPAKYAAALARLVRECGGQIHEHTRLLRYERTGQEFVLTTSRGKLRARDLIVATNGYTTSATSWLRRRIVPVTSYMIATEEIPAATMRQLFPTGRMVTDTNRLLCYYRPSPDNKRILFGGRPAYTEIKPEQSAERLMQYLRRIFPVLYGTSVTHSWFGYIGYTFDHLPHLGKLDGAHYAAGYCGSGVVMATWLGRKVAYRLLGNPEGQSAFAGIRHPTHILYYGRPWFLPLVQAWYQLQDTSARR
ncbi:MAG: FAD-binding oxidoreductase [Betaproteobacteria bacterium]|nr:MAG: FAD-binding oxidoreductase [Betaproteobacteria bacterium]